MLRRSGRVEKETWTPVLACEVRHVKIASSSLRNQNYILGVERENDFQIIMILDFVDMQSQILQHFLLECGSQLQSFGLELSRPPFH